MYPENKRNFNPVGWNEKKLVIEASDVPNRKLPILQVGKT
jgi:hypothetical protein